MATEEKKLTLPAGHPMRGALAPDLSFADGATIDDETQEMLDATAAENEAIIDAEDKIARAELKAAEAQAEAKETVTKQQTTAKTKATSSES